MELAEHLKDLLDEIELGSPKSQTTITDFGVEYDDKDACLNLIFCITVVENKMYMTILHSCSISENLYQALNLF